tara:strand:+ start:760 stop:939 length:180 start_codon:yes stop_codon:yes gene_type:complete
MGDLVSNLQFEVDQFLDGKFQVHTSTCGGAVDLHDHEGWWLTTLEEDEANIENISAISV